MEHFGFSLPESGRVPFSLGTLKANIDSYILRLNGIYRNNLRNSGDLQDTPHTHACAKIWHGK